MLSFGIAGIYPVRGNDLYLPGACGDDLVLEEESNGVSEGIL